MKKSKLSLIVGVVLALFAALSGCSSDEQKIESVSYPVYAPSLLERVEYVSMLTGVNGTTNTYADWNIGGTDLGIPYYDDKQDKMFFLFGDTWDGINSMQGYWRSNVLGVTTDYDASNGIKFDYFYNDGIDDANIASMFMFSPHQGENVGERTRIPTGGIVIDGTHYVFFMSVRKWNTGEATWDTNYCSVFKSTDGAKTWQLMPEISWVGENKQSITMAQNKTIGLGLSEEEATTRNNDNFMMVYPYENGEYIYLYGMTGGRKGGLKLARVKKEDFEDFDKYEYYLGESGGEINWMSGKAGLAATLNNDASFIISARVGELSVAYNPYLKKYMMAYETGSAVLMNLSDDLIHWSKAYTVITSKEVRQLYGGFMHAKYMENDGKTVYFFLSEYKDTTNADNENGYNVKVMKMLFK